MIKKYYSSEGGVIVFYIYMILLPAIPVITTGKIISPLMITIYITGGLLLVLFVLVSTHKSKNIPYITISDNTLIIGNPDNSNCTNTLLLTEIEKVISYTKRSIIVSRINKTDFSIPLANLPNEECDEIFEYLRTVVRK